MAFGIDKLTREVAMLRQLLVSEFHHLERKINHMATQADVDAGLAAVETAVQKLGADMLAAIAALKVRPDQQPTVDALTKIATELDGFDVAAVAEIPPVV